MSVDPPIDASAQLPRGQHGLPRGVVIEHQRQRLIRAVPAAVCAEGYDGVTVATISIQAGVSRRTFYENFRDKEDCFVTSYREHAQELIAAVVGAASAAQTWEERARLAVTALLRFLAQRPDVAQMAVLDVLAAGPAAMAARDEAVVLLATAVADGAAAPGPSQVPPLVRRAIAASILQLIYASVAAGRATELEQLLPTIMYLVLVVSDGPAGAASKTGLGVGVSD